MKVLAWVPEVYDLAPGQRYRIEQWEPCLRERGIELTYSPFSHAGLSQVLKRRGAHLPKAAGVLGGLGRRLLEALRAKDYDLVYVFRESSLIGPAAAERILAARGIPFVFDFDDAVWVRYVSPANAYFSFLRFPGKTATSCRLARHVIAGNKYLAEYAARSNSRVTIVPSTIDTSRYVGARAGTDGIPVLGWTGSYSSTRYLEIVRSVLTRLRQRVEFRLVVVGVAGFEVDGVPTEHRPWRSETEVQDLSDFDVGIMPLADTVWERGKCGMKALQYMALGIPAVASPVGANREIIIHGQNGLLASNESEWLENLEMLLKDRVLRTRLGRAARATVEGSYSAAVHAPRVAAIFQEAVG
jgi:glycosyltransferase involved in cell wall biosynthesis